MFQVPSVVVSSCAKKWIFLLGYFSRSIDSRERRATHRDEFPTFTTFIDSGSLVEYSSENRCFQTKRSLQNYRYFTRSVFQIVRNQLPKDKTSILYLVSG